LFTKSVHQRRAVSVYACEGAEKMKVRSIAIVVVLLVVQSFSAVAQPIRKGVDVEPPQLQKVVAKATAQANDLLASAVAVKPEIPMGPVDVLKEYENEMTVVAQRMSADLTNISQAVGAGQITRDQAEYLIQQRYQTAMMQFQTLSALHDALAEDVARAAGLPKYSGTAAESDTAVIVETPFTRPVLTQQK